MKLIKITDQARPKQSVSSCNYVSIVNIKLIILAV